MATRKLPEWRPPAHIAELMPEVSGNDVNGLGETERRQPTPVMWHRPDRIAHGRVQQHVNASYETHPLLAGIFNTPERRDRGIPVAEAQEEDAPDNWTARVKEFALANEADLVAIAPVDQNWVFEGFTVTDPWVVVLGVYMDHSNLKTAPEPTAALEVATQYNRGNRAAHALQNWIRARGHSAHGHGGPGAGPINLIPAALAAGFGELGKHGSIINRRFGSSFRLAGVVTSLPLVPDAPDSFGADDFCASCQVCANACPPMAITHEKHTVRGVDKWYVDFDRCMPYFADNFGCGICIAVCPWSRPGTAPKLAERMTRRRERPDEAA